MSVISLTHGRVVGGVTGRLSSDWLCDSASLSPFLATDPDECIGGACAWEGAACYIIAAATSKF